jgi:hypothetical protein
MKKPFVNCVFKKILLNVTAMNFVYLQTFQTFAAIIGIMSI